MRVQQLQRQLRVVERVGIGQRINAGDEAGPVDAQLGDQILRRDAQRSGLPRQHLGHAIDRAGVGEVDRVIGALLHIEAAA